MRRVRGFTLLELTIAMVCVAGASVALARALMSSGKAATTTTTRHGVDAALERDLSRIRDELGFAGLATLATEVDGATVPIIDGVSYQNILFAPVVDVTAAGLEYGAV